jgi:hypothetical protein
MSYNIMESMVRQRLREKNGQTGLLRRRPGEGS